MAPSVFSERVYSPSHGLTKSDIEAYVKPIIASLEDEDSDTANLVRVPTTKPANGHHQETHTPDTIESLNYNDPVVIIGMGK